MARFKQTVKIGLLFSPKRKSDHFHVVAVKRFFGTSLSTMLLYKLLSNTYTTFMVFSNTKLLSV